MSKIKIGIIEDDNFVMQSLIDIVKSSTKLEYVMSANSAELFLKYYKEQIDLDILLVDVGLPGMSGIQALLKVKNINPTVDAIILSSFHDNDTIFSAFRAGATGYLLKGATFDEIEIKLIETRKGIPALSPAIAKRVIGYFNTNKIEDRDYQLKIKEKQVLQLLIEGNSYKMIAAKMDVSVDGVRYHIKNIYKKLQINSRAELSSLYINGRIKL